MNPNFKNAWVPQALWFPQLTSVKTISDDRGQLGVIEAMPDTGFSFKRLYFLYNNSPETSRGQHAHKGLWQYMIAMHGSFRVVLKGRGETFEFNLSSQQEGLIIPPGYWRDLDNFSSDCVCLVAASEEYDESDYIRNYDDFLKWEMQK